METTTVRVTNGQRLKVKKEFQGLFSQKVLESALFVKDSAPGVGARDMTFVEIIDGNGNQVWGQNLGVEQVINKFPLNWFNPVADMKFTIGQLVEIDEKHLGHFHEDCFLYKKYVAAMGETPGTIIVKDEYGRLTEDRHHKTSLPDEWFVPKTA